LRNSATVAQPRGGPVAQPVWVAVVENAAHGSKRIDVIDNGRCCPEDGEGELV
jgi:hypothetical protein